MSGHSFSFTSIRCHAYLFKFVYCCIRKGSFDGHSTYKHSLHIYLNSFLTNYNLQMSFYTPSMVFRSCMFSEIDVFTNFILLFRSYLSVSTCTSRVHDRCELFNTAEFIPLSIVSRRLFHLETLDKNWGGEGVGNTGAMAARLGKFNLVTETGVERAGRKKWNRGVSDNAVGQRCFASIVARTASVSNKGWKTKQVRQVEGCD